MFNILKYLVSVILTTIVSVTVTLGYTGLNYNASNSNNNSNKVVQNISSTQLRTGGFDQTKYYLPFEVGSDIYTSQGYNRDCPGCTSSKQLTHGANEKSLDIYPNADESLDFNVLAARPGKVIYSGYGFNRSASYGNTVLIEHSDKSVAQYSHLKNRAVSVNQHVNQAQVLGLMGGTGLNYSNTDWPKHLHFSEWNSSSLNYQIITIFAECNCTPRGGTFNLSQNRSAPALPPTFNRFTGRVSLQTNNSLTLGVTSDYPNNGTQVKLFVNNNGVNQKWSYIASSKEIKGINDKCLDGGNISDPNNRWLRIHDCHGQTNQKWEADASGRIRSVANSNLCIDSATGNTNGAMVYLSPCHNGYNQQWNWW